VGAYIVRRILIAIPVLLGISVAGFFALALAPGDPVTSMIDPEALRRMSPEQIEQIRHQLGLDGPIIVRYGRWLADVVRGNLGYSIITSRPGIVELATRIGPTLLLMGTAVAIALLIGIPCGVISAVRQYSRLDYAVTTFSLAMISTPTFLLGLIFIYTFAVTLKWLPAGGLATLGVPFSLTDRLEHLVMPALILGLANAAPLMRYTRGSMLEVINSDYITTARAKGLAGRVVLIRHGLRNALIPIITLIGLLLPELVAGAVITEQVFAWPGMGQLAVTAADRRDPALMMGVMMLVAVGVLVSSLLADIAYATVDPRVRLGAH
jgi:peptide/nickel transport system permease protein